MGLQDISDLNAVQLDALQEIGNIGSGNAATSLSMMLGQPIGISVPKIKILDVNEVTDALGGPENMVIGLLLSLGGDVAGMMMFLLEQDFARTALQGLMGIKIEDFTQLDEMGYSAIKEVANIMISSYVNAVSDLTSLEISLSAPDLCIDMIGAILTVPAIHFANLSDKIIFIEDQFHIQVEHMQSHMLMIPDVESLSKIMKNLGIMT